MPEDFEQRITRALTEYGGPPELATQLAAMARNFARQAPRLNWEAKALDWVRFHVGEHWSAAGFQGWAVRYMETEEAMKKLKELQNAG